MISMQVLRDFWSLWGDKGARCIFALISSQQIGILGFRSSYCPPLTAGTMEICEFLGTRVVSPPV
jgi:hypothetical protein